MEPLSSSNNKHMDKEAEADCKRSEEARLQREVDALKDEMKVTEDSTEKFLMDLEGTDLYLDVYGPEEDEFDISGEQRESRAERVVLVASIRENEAKQRKRRKQLRLLQSELKSLASHQKALSPDRSETIGKKIVSKGDCMRPKAAVVSKLSKNDAGCPMETIAKSEADQRRPDAVGSKLLKSDIKEDPVVKIESGADWTQPEAVASKQLKSETSEDGVRPEEVVSILSEGDQEPMGQRATPDPGSIRSEEEMVQQELDALNDKLKGTHALIRKLRGDLHETNLCADFVDPKHDTNAIIEERRKVGAQRPILAASIRENEATEQEQTMQLQALQSKLNRLTSHRKRFELSCDRNDEPTKKKAKSEADWMLPEAVGSKLFLKTTRWKRLRNRKLIRDALTL